MKKKDALILSHLKENSRISFTELSSKTGIPDTTIHYRLKKLLPFIEKFSVSLNYEKMGYKLYLLEIEPDRFTLDFITERNIDTVKEALTKIEGIIFLAEVDDRLIAVYKTKDRVKVEVSGAKVTKYQEIKNRIGNFVEF
ncbi:MAG: Lrp/AsnC family transcriptional regulator [Candidatus Methanofastidiosia archaeon]